MKQFRWNCIWRFISIAVETNFLKRALQNILSNNPPCPPLAKPAQHLTQKPPRSTAQITHINSMSPYLVDVHGPVWCVYFPHRLICDRINPSHCCCCCIYDYTLRMIYNLYLYRFMTKINLTVNRKCSWLCNVI